MVLPLQDRFSLFLSLFSVSFISIVFVCSFVCWLLCLCWGARFFITPNTTNPNYLFFFIRSRINYISGVCLSLLCTICSFSIYDLLGVVWVPLVQCWTTYTNVNTLLSWFMLMLAQNSIQLQMLRQIARACMWESESGCESDRKVNMLMRTFYNTVDRIECVMFQFYRQFHVKYGRAHIVERVKKKRICQIGIGFYALENVS